jgi:hypothetical protein
VIVVVASLGFGKCPDETPPSDERKGSSSRYAARHHVYSVADLKNLNSHRHGRVNAVHAR